MNKFIVAFKVSLLATCALTCIQPALACSAAPGLETGYLQMYNLDFPAAHTTFAVWEHDHPQDPMGFVSDGAAHLFSEFNRLHVLEFDLFTQDSTFKARKELTPDPSVKQQFNNDLDQADKLASQILAHSPNDQGAILAEVMVNGLRGDYVALIENRSLASLSYMKKSRAMADKLIAADTSCYDAYLALGAENYILSLNSAPVRWILRITGSQTDKEQGIAWLKLAAEKGAYLAPYARLLLAVAALRDRDNKTARDLLQGLAAQFPRNDLYAKELARIN
ncbi:MAG TPA: hypothetical protein VGF44_07490 [Terriglobales bacterium]